MASSEPVDETALFTVVPEGFIAARTGLVKRLRSEGDKAQAVRVAKLRRPPLTAWALNQVARTAPALIDALITAGSQLRAAMEQAVGGDASALRPARAEERRAVDVVLAEAARRIEDAGYSATEIMRERMEATLRAAVVDQSVAVPLRQGVLDGDRDAPGFGMDALSLPETSPSAAGDSSSEPAAVQAAPEADVDAAPEAGPAAPETPAPAPDAGDTERRQRAQRETARLVAEADGLREEADRLMRQAEQLAADANAAMKRATDARRRADDALRSAAALLAQVNT